MKNIIFIPIIVFILILLFFVSGCTSKESYIKAKCEDGFEYNKEHCVNNKCTVINYFADPCLNHYNKECNSDQDCNAAGCSGQVCTTKAKSIDLITTCEYKEEYQCLKLTSCLCINNKCMFDENQDYLSCLSEIK